jgi:hypothetical protein
MTTRTVTFEELHEIWAEERYRERMKHNEQ